MNKSPTQKVLEALEARCEVKLGHYMWSMQEGVDAYSEFGGDPSTPRKLLCIKMFNETKNVAHYINPTISFNDFMVLCNGLSTEELSSLTSKTTIEDL